MAAPLSYLRDDFADNQIAPTWAAGGTNGSGTRSETGGQAVLQLPSSTAGAHAASYSTAGRYDLTGDSVTWNIATMVSTAVAASAYLQLIDSVAATGGQLYWLQVSGTLTAHKLDGGVDTVLYSVAWNAATFKYLRIAEQTGTVYFYSSTNGTTWTLRASTTTATPIDNMIVQMFATCGNVASPGALKIEDVNLILPALSTTWRFITGSRALLNRVRVIGLSASGGQGCIVTATATDNAGALAGPRYFAGPLGSSSGGYHQLVEYSTLAAAQAMAVDLPADDRWDLPVQVECRVVRLYLRSISGAATVVNEFYPRRLVQSDDIEAESIRAINIAAGTITADKIFVLNLAALSAFIGQLSIDTTGWIYQGSGTGASPTTGMKIFNSGGFGQISFYNSSAAILDIDQNGMRVHAIAGADVLSTPNAVTWIDASANEIGALYGSYAGAYNYIGLRGEYKASRKGYVSVYAEDASGAQVGIAADADGTNAAAGLSLISLNNRIRILASKVVRVDGNGLYVGTAFLDPTMAAGQINTDDSVGFGVAVNAQARLYVKGKDATSGNYGVIVLNSASATEFYIRNDGVGFLNNTAWTYSSDASKKKNIRALGKDVRDFLLLEPRAFDYIDGQANRWGYIAQEVQAILPDLIETQDDGSLGMRTDELLPLFNHVLRRLIRVLLQKNVIGPADIV